MHQGYPFLPSLLASPWRSGGSEGTPGGDGSWSAGSAAEAMLALNIRPADLTVVVQGFGNVGSIWARLMYELGCKVVGLSDINGGVYNPNGIDVHLALRHSKRTRDTRLACPTQNLLPTRNCWNYRAMS